MTHARTTRQYSDEQWQRIANLAIERGKAEPEKIHGLRGLMDCYLEAAEGFGPHHETIKRLIYDEPTIWAGVQASVAEIMSALREMEHLTYSIGEHDDDWKNTFRDPARLAPFLVELRAFGHFAGRASRRGLERRPGRSRTPRNQVWGSFLRVWQSHFELKVGTGENSPAADFLIEASRPISWIDANTLSAAAARGFIRDYVGRQRTF